MAARARRTAPGRPRWTPRTGTGRVRARCARPPPGHRPPGARPPHGSPRGSSPTSPACSQTTAAWAPSTSAAMASPSSTRCGRSWSRAASLTLAGSPSAPFATTRPPPPAASAARHFAGDREVPAALTGQARALQVGQHGVAPAPGGLRPRPVHPEVVRQRVRLDPGRASPRPQGEDRGPVQQARGAPGGLLDGRVVVPSGQGSAGTLCSQRSSRWTWLALMRPAGRCARRPPRNGPTASGPRTGSARAARRRRR